MKKLCMAALLGLSTTALANQAVPGQYIVKIKKGMERSFYTSKSMKSHLRMRSIRSKKSSFVLVKPRSKSFNPKSLMRSPFVEYVEPNYIFKAPKTKASPENYNPNDQLFLELWGLHNTGNNDKGAQANVDINALRAWKSTLGNKKVVIGVIDSGIDPLHPDLKANLWTNIAEKMGQPGVDDDGNGYVDDVIGYDFIDKDSMPEDGLDHGTHVAGTIGAVHNSHGVAGVVRNASMMIAKIFNKNGTTTSEAIINAILYCVDNGAHVLNNSWGGGQFSQGIRDAIEYANSKGVIFVAAAGNYGINNDKQPFYPASYKLPNIISVAALASNGKLASFSHYGVESVDVAAPGHRILSTIPGGEYKSLSGTSMASPHVTGVVALVLSMKTSALNKKGSSRNLNLDPAKVRELLVKTSVALPALDGKIASAGRVDAARAVEAIK